LFLFLIIPLSLYSFEDIKMKCTIMFYENYREAFKSHQYDWLVES